MAGINFNDTTKKALSSSSGGVTDNAIVRFDGTTGAVFQNSNVTIDDNGFMQLSVSTEQALEILSTHGVGTGENMVLIENTNPAWDRPLLRINDSSTEGGAANIRIDSPNPDIELIETDETSPNGKFEIAVQSNKLQFNSRNSADDSFEPIATFAQYKNGGALGIGTQYDTANASLEIATYPAQDHFMISTVVGASSGNIFWVDNAGNVIINNGAAAVTMLMKGDTDPELFFIDGPNNRVLVGMDSGGLQKFHVRGRAQFGLASDTSGTIDLANSGAAGLTRLSPGAPGSDVTMTFPIVSGTVALTTGNASLSASRFIGGSSTPGIAAGAGAGTSPTISITGNDTSGTVSLTTGTTPSGSNAIIATITFNTTYSSQPQVVLCPANRNAQALAVTSQVLVPADGQTNGVTTTTFVIESGTVGLVGATAYLWSYHVIQ